MGPRDILADLLAGLRLALSFFTRLPVGSPASADFVRALWAAPVAGAVVGGLAAAVYALAHALGVPATVAAALAVGAGILVTGALHEDGLADTADGFGGGRTRERKLEIMRDSRIGTYGVCALLLSVLIRWSAIAALAGPEAVALALVAAHAAARGAVPVLMRLLPGARPDGLSATAGRPPAGTVAVAGLFGAAALGLPGLRTAVVALVLIVLATALLARLCRRQIGGQTGDTLGALEQVCETIVLVVCAAQAD